MRKMSPVWKTAKLSNSILGEKKNINKFLFKMVNVSQNWTNFPTWIDMVHIPRIHKELLQINKQKENNWEKWLEKLTKVHKKWNHAEAKYERPHSYTTLVR